MVAGLIRVAGAALAAVTACGDASSPFGGVTNEAFLGAPGALGLCTGTAVGGGGAWVWRGSAAAESMVSMSRMRGD